MSSTRTDVDDADRLVRVTLSRTIEPGDLRVTGLVSELGADKVLGHLEAAAGLESHGGSALVQERSRVDPAAAVLAHAAAGGIRFIVPGDAECPTQLDSFRNADLSTNAAANPSASRSALTGSLGRRQRDGRRARCRTDLVLPQLCGQTLLSQLPIQPLAAGEGTRFAPVPVPTLHRTLTVIGGGMG
ncbi:MULTISPECIES: hypothetical protein [unclassified Nocardioides]|uniref:hypothetical protein n=1 Tax=unclassified Nocardioides TaxID=2615069 RepID=UPI0009F0E438|nr:MULTISPECIES: hypothetical protein [unclassified Nocardioides]GAW49674.1 DNA protecting protein DprA [Nocardioides sp. PD653-B2]GAW56586.1 DNA protecting protein DprA [Nocardioides sp. PD653]